MNGQNPTKTVSLFGKNSSEEKLKNKKPIGVNAIARKLEIEITKLNRCVKISKIYKILQYFAW